MTNLKLPPLDYRSLLARGTGKIAYATTITVEDDIVKILHHGHTIATLTPYSVMLDNCGYHSRTTAHRLSAVASENNVGRVNIVKGVMTFTDNNGQPREMHEMIGIATYL